MTWESNDQIAAMFNCALKVCIIAFLSVVGMSTFGRYLDSFKDSISKLDGDKCVALMLQFDITVLVLLFLVWQMPKLVQGLLSGSPQFGAGQMVSMIASGVTSAATVVGGLAGVGALATAGAGASTGGAVGGGPSAGGAAKMSAIANPAGGGPDATGGMQSAEFQSPEPKMGNYTASAPVSGPSDNQSASSSESSNGLREVAGPGGESKSSSESKASMADIGNKEGGTSIPESSLDDASKMSNKRSLDVGGSDVSSMKSETGGKSDTGSSDDKKKEGSSSDSGLDDDSKMSKKRNLDAAGVDISGMKDENAGSGGGKLDTLQRYGEATLKAVGNAATHAAFNSAPVRAFQNGYNAVTDPYGVGPSGKAEGAAGKSWQSGNMVDAAGNEITGKSNDKTVTDQVHIHRVSEVIEEGAASAEVSIGGQNYTLTVKPSSVSKPPEPLTPFNPNDK